MRHDLPRVANQNRQLASKLCAEVEGQWTYAAKTDRGRHPWFLASAATVLCSVLMVCHVGRASDISLEYKCPGAANWYKRHPEYSKEAMLLRDGTRTLSKPDLLAELQRRVDADQHARRLYMSRPNDSSVQHNLVVDKENLRWLRQLFGTQGYPSAAAIGEFGMHLTWILLQHADLDPKFQASLIPIVLERYEAGEMPPTDVSRFVDRSLKARGQPQLYGTQFDWLSGHFKLPQREITKRINANRSEIGLMPLEDYACAVNLRLSE